MQHEYLVRRGLDPELSYENGWYPSRDAGDTHARVVIPASNKEKFPFWQARLMRPLKEGEVRYQSPHGVARLSSIVVTHPPIDRFPLRRPPQAVITEGPMDALAASSLGFMGLALMGNTPNDLVLSYVQYRIVRATKGKIILLADRDSVSSFALVGNKLASSGLPVNLITPPSPYKDLCEMPIPDRERFLTDAKD